MTLTIVDPMTPPPSAHHVAVPGGEAYIWLVDRYIVVQKARGILSIELAHCFGEFYRPILRPGANVRVFDDFEALDHYTRDAREYLTELTMRNLDAIDRLHFLLSSKFMALGVSAFKHTIGDERVRVYFDRASFVRSYERALGAGRDSVAQAGDGR